MLRANDNAGMMATETLVCLIFSLTPWRDAGAMDGSGVPERWTF